VVPFFIPKLPVPQSFSVTPALQLAVILAMIVYHALRAAKGLVQLESINLKSLKHKYSTYKNGDLG